MTFVLMAVVNMDFNRMMVHIKTPDMKHSSLKHVVSQFTTRLWTTTIVTLMILSLFLSATWYARIHCNYRQEVISYKFIDTWLYTIGIMCQQGVLTFPSKIT